MNENQSSDTLINQIYNILSDLSKKWQIILLITVVCALGFDTYKSITYVPMYRSEATYAVKSYYGYGANDAKQDIGETFSYIFSSNVFKNKIEKELGVEKLDGVFKAEHLKDTNVLRVYAESSSIRTSYEMMKALQVYYSDLSNLVVGKSNIDVLQELSIPSSPYNGFSHKRNIVKVGFIAFVLSAGFFAFLSIVNDTLKDKTEVEKKLNLRLLGSLPIESKIINWKNLKRKKRFLFLNIQQVSTTLNH